MPESGLTTDAKPRSYQNLSPRARLSVGAGLLAWGVVGLLLSERAEQKLGLTPSEEDKAALDRMLPKITVAERDQRKR